MVIVMKRLISVSAMAALFTALSGCANAPAKGVAGFSEPDEKALSELMAVAVEARDEMRILAKTNEAVAQKTMTKEQREQRYFQATHVPEGFDQIGSFKYIGKASKAAEALALMAGYEFAVDGEPMAVEPWVHINTRRQPLNEALKEIGLQTGDAILIEVHPEVLRFIYQR